MPEQALEGRADACSDLYSVGCILHELIVGQPTFCDGREDLLAQHAVAAPRPPRSFDPAIPPSLEHVVLRLLENDPAARHARADKVREALQAHIQDERHLELIRHRLSPSGLRRRRLYG